MTDRTMTSLIPIGDVELPLTLIARALGIPAATLDKLASGEWVAVPREPTEAMLNAGETPGWSRWETRGRYRFMIEAASEAGSHD